MALHSCVVPFPFLVRGKSFLVVPNSEISVRLKTSSLGSLPGLTIL